MSNQVLLADDDALRGVLWSILTRYGYEVITCADGREALSVFQRDPVRFNIVILDNMMPKMGGAQTAIAIRELSNVPILLMSGHSAHQTLNRVEGLEQIGFCQKPFQLKQLIKTLSSMIHSNITDELRQAPSPLSLSEYTVGS